VQQVSDVVRAACRQGRAHVVGLSYGGVVTQALMAQRPEVVDHVILGGTAARAGKGLMVALRASLALNRPLLDRLSPSVIARLIAIQFGIPPQYRLAMAEDIKRVRPAVLTQTILGTYGSIVTPQDFPGPALVAVGQRETFVARRMARRLARLLPGARGVVAPGGGHVWNLQMPELFAEMVRAWVTGRPLPGQLMPLA
jgi:pimeloyl-ACP methyl ester carboxylesterase